MEESRWPHGWADHQWGSCNASERGFHRRIQTWCLEGNLGLWGRLHSPRNQVGSAERETGKFLLYIIDLCIRQGF